MRKKVCKESMQRVVWKENKRGKEIENKIIIIQIEIKNKV
jgi:hypothetical protein